MLSNRELWCILTGRTSVLLQAEIRRVLSENVVALMKCLSNYNYPNSSSMKKLTTNKTVKKKDFVKKLSKLLNLDEWQTHLLFQNFVRTEYRGCTDQLKKIFQHDMQIEGLTYKILDYYFMERKYLLWCIKFVLSYWQDPSCYFRAELAVTVDELVNGGFIDNIIVQYEELSANGFVHDGIKGNSPVERNFATEGVETQCDLLEIILLYYKDFEISGKRLLEISNIFQVRGFGLKQPEKRLLDQSGDAIIEKVGFLANLILLEATDLEFFANVQHNESSVKEHHLARDLNIIKRLDEIFLDWADIQSRSPIFLSWALLRFYIRNEDGFKVCQVLGQNAVQSHVLEYLLAILKWSSFLSGPLKNLIKSLISSLVNQSLIVFHESSFGESQQLYSLTKHVLYLPGASKEILSSKTSLSGLKLVLASAKNKFPYVICPFMDILSVLCNDEDSANHIFDYVRYMQTMTELFRSNKAAEIEATIDECAWKRSVDRMCVSSGTGQDKIVIPGGTVGKIIDNQTENRLICWMFEYSGWNYLTLELEQHVSNPGDYSLHFQEDVQSRLISIVSLLSAIMEHDWSKAEFLEPMIACLFSALERFCTISSPPLEFVAVCLKALAITAKHAPRQVLNHLNQIGFLPKAAEDQTLSYNYGGIIHLIPGAYGQLLSSAECALGSYHVTKGYLDFFLQLHNMTIDVTSALLCEESLVVLLASIVFIVRHIFGSYHKWKFVDHFDKVEIGEKTLEILHTILASSYTEDHPNVAFKYISFAKGIISEALLYHEAGESLLQILGTGVDSVNASVIDGVRCNNRGCQTTLVQLVKLGLAVLDTLLGNKESDTITPMENAIFSKYVMQESDWEFVESTEMYPLLILIAKYIYHDYDAKLPTLAVIVLQKLCLTSPVSLLACFGQGAVALRNAFVTRLECAIEPVRLKIAIVNFLTSSVESQPGLVELFVDQGDEEGLSCLPVVLRFVSQSDYQMALRKAALRFLHALWSSRTDSALSIIRKRENSWKDISSLLFHSSNDTLSFEEMGCCALIIQIITLEVYYISNEVFDDFFIECLKAMGNKFYKQIGKILSHPQHLKTSPNFKQNKLSLLNFITAWKEYLLVASLLHPEQCMLNSGKVKECILVDAVSVFQIWVDEKVCEISEELANTIMVLSSRWSNSVSQVSGVINDIISLLQKCFTERDAVFTTSKVQLFSSILSILEGNLSLNEKYFENNEHVLLKLVPLIGQALQDIKLICIHRGKGRLDSRSFNVSLLVLNLMSSLAKYLSNKAPLCSMIQEYTAMPIILQTVSYCLQAKTCLNFVQSALPMFLAFAEDKQMAEMMGSSGIVQALNVNFNISEHQQSNTVFDQKLILQEIWCHSLSIVTAILKASGNNFLNQVMDFVGAYREQTIQSTNITGRVNSLPLLQESELTSRLLFTLSPFWMRWRFIQPDVVTRFQSGIMLMLQTSIAFLSRPRLLSHVAASQDKISLETLLERARTPSPSFSRDNNSSTFAREDYTELLCGAAGETQERLINIAVNCIGTLRKIIPNVAEAILDEDMDLDSFSPLVELTFNSPSLDEKSAISFGILISCMNTSLRILQQITPLESPRTSPLKEHFGADVERCFKLRLALNYMIENSIVIIMSQASCYLRCAGIDPRTKQFLKRELGSEMTNFLYSLHRHLSKRSVPLTPKSGDKWSPQSSLKRSPSKLGPVFAEDEDNTIYKVADFYAKQLLQ